VILISTHSEADFADLIAESPAAGFVPEPELSAEAIRRIVDGRAPGGPRGARARRDSPSGPAGRLAES